MTAFLLISVAVMLLISVPIGIAIGAASLISIVQSGMNVLIVTQKLTNGVESFSLIAIPFFILAGEVMSTGGLSGRLLYLANKMVGWITGGLAMVATLAATFFGAISGSAAATTAAIGGIMIPSMKKAGYSPQYSAAVIASSGLLGLIIPPSGTMIMYAIVANVSIKEMFLGGMVPGILMALSLMVMEFFRAKRKGYGKANFELEEFQGVSKGRILFQSFIALLSPVIILGGIYSGAFTATEASGIAVLYGLFAGYLIYKEMSLKDLFSSCIRTGISSSIILFLIACAAVFGWVLTMQQIPTMLVSFIQSFTNDPRIVLLLCNIALLVAGALLDNVAAITLLTPVLCPLVQSFGINTTFFGLIMIINLAIGQITPPIGMNLFVAANITGIKVESIVKQVIPFLILLIIDLFIFTYIPVIITGPLSFIVGYPIVAY